MYAITGITGQIEGVIGRILLSAEQPVRADQDFVRPRGETHGAGDWSRGVRSRKKGQGEDPSILRYSTLLGTPSALIFLFKRGLSGSQLVFLGRASDD